MFVLHDIKELSEPKQNTRDNHTQPTQSKHQKNIQYHEGEIFYV